MFSSRVTFQPEVRTSLQILHYDIQPFQLIRHGSGGKHEQRYASCPSTLKMLVMKRAYGLSSMESGRGRDTDIFNTSLLYDGAKNRFELLIDLPSFFNAITVQLLDAIEITRLIASYQIECVQSFVI